MVLGGAQATVCTEQSLRAGFDCAVLGEAERTIVELVENLDRDRMLETRGIAFLNDAGEVVKTPDQPLIEDLDSLPFPARDLYDYDAFRAAGGWEFGMMSSRGCPFRCTFCQPTLNMIFGRMRQRGPENVAPSRYGARPLTQFGTTVTTPRCVCAALSWYEPVTIVT